MEVSHSLLGDKLGAITAFMGHLFTVVDLDPEEAELCRIFLSASDACRTSSSLLVLSILDSI